MLSIQPLDTLWLTVQLSSGDAGEREIPLINSVSERKRPSQHKLLKSCWRLLGAKGKTRLWRGKLKTNIIKQVSNRRNSADPTALSLSSPLYWMLCCNQKHLLSGLSAAMPLLNAPLRTVRRRRQHAAENRSELFLSKWFHSFSRQSDLAQNKQWEMWDYWVRTLFALGISLFEDILSFLWMSEEPEEGKISSISQ